MRKYFLFTWNCVLLMCFIIFHFENTTNFQQKVLSVELQLITPQTTFVVSTVWNHTKFSIVARIAKRTN